MCSSCSPWQPNQWETLHQSHLCLKCHPSWWIQNFPHWCRHPSHLDHSHQRIFLISHGRSRKINPWCFVCFEMFDQKQGNCCRWRSHRGRDCQTARGLRLGPKRHLRKSCRKVRRSTWGHSLHPRLKLRFEPNQNCHRNEKQTSVGFQVLWTKGQNRSHCGQHSGA